jgi:hypothetical protein
VNNIYKIHESIVTLLTNIPCRGDHRAPGGEETGPVTKSLPSGPELCDICGEKCVYRRCDPTFDDERFVAGENS